MLQVKTPATTSNLGVGFDCLGMSLNLYNTFQFTERYDFELVGFETENIEDNLVKKAYLDCCAAHHIKNIQPLRIEMVEQHIPIARGLGSSASCIVAGCIAANHFHNLNLNTEDIAKFSALYEGHPDNAYACVFGGFVSIFKEENTYYFDQFTLSKKLKFAVLIPNMTGKTETLRSILPKKIKLEDAVYNLGRIIHLPKALQAGNVVRLKQLLKDKYHETYRKAFIPRYDELLKESNEANIIQLISGSGPSLFFISETDVFESINQYKELYTLFKVSVSTGTVWEVL